MDEKKYDIYPYEVFLKDVNHALSTQWDKHGRHGPLPELCFDGIKFAVRNWCAENQ